MHRVLLAFLLVLIALFLSAFLYTCFSHPATEQTQVVVEVSTQPEIEEPVVPFEPEPIPRQPLPPRFVGTSVVVASMPLPQQLLSFPRFPKPGTAIVLPSVPAAPTFVGEPTSKAFVPEPPFIFEPLVLTEEEYDLFYPAPQEEPQSDDFWSDFFIVGEDSTIAYEDGFYYSSLFVNDELVGDIEVQFLGEARLINMQELSSYVGSYLTDSAFQNLFGDGSQYLSLDELQERGVQARFDAAAFAVYLQFNLQDMPERTVSITSSSINRREQYAISGAIQLKPAKFALASSLSLYALLDYPSDFSKFEKQLFSLSVSNRASILGIGLNSYFSITSTPPYINLGSWNGFYDFVESSHRLSFGNVGTNLNSSVNAESNFGFMFEKNYAYGTGSAKGSQFEHRIVLIEKSTVIVSINEQEVFKRDFQAGTYRLRDFVFTQGANQIKITIIPDSHPEDKTIEYVDMGYDYRLLGKGDSLYGFGFSVPRTTTTDASGTINLPWFDNEYFSYHLDAFTATYYQQTGLTDTFTFTTEVAISPGMFSGTFNGVLATLVGTSQLQVSLGLDESKITPSLSLSLSHRLSGKQEDKFGTLSGTINHTIPAMDSLDPYTSTTTLSLTYSGSLTEKIRYTLSGNYLQTLNENPAGSISFATGFSPFRGFSLSGSITANFTGSNPLSPTVSAQISGSYSFSPKLSGNSSTTIQSGTPFFAGTSTSSLGMSWRPSSRDSFNFSLSSFEFATPKDHSLLASWSHSGDLFALSVRQQISNSYQDMSTSVTASTSLAYAQGAFGIGRSVGESFLLVKPVGDLKKSQVSVARSLDSAPSYLSRPLGSALYNNLSLNAKNSVVVFSTGLTEYSTGSSFVYELTPRSRQSFVAKLDVEPSFTVSAVILMSDATPYIQYSSPVYKVELDEQGNEELIRDDSLYLFTDQEGRFILSEVSSGTYLFDLQVGDLWYAVRFTIPAFDSESLGLDRVLLLEDFWVSDPAFESRIIIKDALTGFAVEKQEDVFGSSLATGYDAEVTLEIVDRIDEETFWSIIFQPFDESDFGLENFDADFVTEDDFTYDGETFDALVGEYEEDPTATQVVTAAP